MIKILMLAVSHTLVFALGFALGVYLLPILTAPEGPTEAEIMASAEGAAFTATFKRGLKGSDRFHWGEGTIAIGADRVSFMGELSPGPDYKLYLSPRYVEDEAEFNAVKSQSVRIGAIKTFDGFILNLPPGVAPDQYTTAVVWCEAFGEFITAGAYR